MENQDLKTPKTGEKTELPYQENNQSQNSGSDTTTEIVDFELDDIEVIESKVFA